MLSDDYPAIIDFLEKEMNKYGILYFVQSEEDENIILARFKDNNKVFAKFYIDKIKDLLLYLWKERGVN